MSLNNLSASRADLVRREDALAALAEAARWPDAYYQLEQSLRATCCLAPARSRQPHFVKGPGLTAAEPAEAGLSHVG